MPPRSIVDGREVPTKGCTLISDLLMAIKFYTCMRDLEKAMSVFYNTYISRKFIKQSVVLYAQDSLGLVYSSIPALNNVF